MNLNIPGRPPICKTPEEEPTGSSDRSIGGLRINANGRKYHKTEGMKYNKKFKYVKGGIYGENEHRERIKYLKKRKYTGKSKYYLVRGKHARKGKYHVIRKKYARKGKYVKKGKFEKKIIHQKKRVYKKKKIYTKKGYLREPSRRPPTENDKGPGPVAGENELGSKPPTENDKGPGPVAGENELGSKPPTENDKGPGPVAGENELGSKPPTENEEAGVSENQIPEEGSEISPRK